MKKQKSVTQLYFYSMTLFSLLISFILGGLWISKEVNRFNKETAATRQEYVDSQKELMKSEVATAVAYIDYQKSLAEKRLKKEVKSRTEEAYNSVLYIYEVNKNKKPLAEIKQMVHDALFAASWDEGRGYYFAEDMNGTELVNRNNPDLEGENIIDIQDSKGNYLMRDILAVANSPQREGFCSYYWNKPENPGVHVPKISYVKYFEPFDWVIGNGKYLDDQEKEIKEEILSRIGKMRVGVDGYLFIGTWAGVSILGPESSIGKNMLDITDANGVKVVQELIEASKAEGGFVHYIMPKFEGQQPLPKISYAIGLPDWQWYIGTGLYIDEIEKVILQKQAQLKSEIKFFIFQVITLLCFLVFLVNLLARFVTVKIKNNLDLFSKFFEEAATHSFPIDQKKAFFSEFQVLATSANKMIEQRQKSEKEKDLLEEKLNQAHKMEAIGTLTGGIAHDFNNILSAIIGYSELAKSELDDGSNASANLVEVLKASQRATELVKQLLTFSRKGAHKREALKPYVIVKEALKLMRASLPTTMKLEEDIDPESGSILADPTKIHQIIVNLCTNALHAMEEETGVLKVALIRTELSADKVLGYPDILPGQFVELSVSDSGCGMDRQTQQRIFEPYFTTKATGKGTGLGLAVVLGIVQDCGAMITVDSEPGKGTTFHIYFPAVSAKIKKFEEEEKTILTGSERILIVDDESSIAALQLAVLSRLGYTVTAKASSEEALAVLKSDPQSFDLLITDQTMPVLSGAALAKEVLSLRSDMPIILCTGYSATLSEEKAMAIGIKKYLIKPVDSKDLAKIVREVLDEN